MEDHTCKWVVGLSNGETIIENMDRFLDIEGEPSSWQKLQTYLIQNNLQINSIKIRVYSYTGNRDYNLPSTKPKFNSSIPIDYNYGRKVGIQINSIGEIVSTEQKHIFIEAIYPEGNVRLYVDELNPVNCWVTFNINKGK